MHIGVRQTQEAPRRALAWEDELTRVGHKPETIKAQNREE